MNLLLQCLFVFSMTSVLSSANAARIDDPLSTEDLTLPPREKVIALLDSIQDPCASKSVALQLNLLDAIEGALCHNHATKQAWANVKYEAAQLGIKEAAYLPTINATYAVTRENINTQYEGFPQFGTIAPMTTRNASMDLSWLIFDFGSRHNDLVKHQQLLAAANALQNASLQTVFMDTAQDYFDLISAQGALDASRQSEKSARENYMAAEAKYTAGAGALADKLLAQTTFAQASLDRVKAEGGLRTAQGKLAIAMGLAVNTEFTLQPMNPALPDTEFVQSLDNLIAYANKNHPKMVAARAQLLAANAELRVNQAAAYPTVSLVGNITHTDQVGQLPTNTFILNKKIGIQISIPLFDGFNRAYLIQTARAKLAQQEAILEDTEQQVALEVWTSYQSLTTETENLKSTSYLLASSSQSYQVAQGRYKAGVGNILELLKAQSDLAGAKQQRVQALSNWQTARLKLAGSLGKLGLWAIK